MLEIKQFLQENESRPFVALYKSIDKHIGNVGFLAAHGHELIPTLNKLSLTDSKWKMGFICYDYKNSIETLLTQQAPEIVFPNVHFFSPEKIYVLSAKKSTVAEQTHSKDIPIRCRTDKRGYTEAVRHIQGHILRGDIYELNYCIEFYVEDASLDPAELFLRLNERTDSPFATFIKTGNKYLIGASPERFLKKTGRTLISQPMKGTAPRSQDTGEDVQLLHQLLSDQKEIAENIMITDLVRNDLSKVAIRSSVTVKDLCKAETFKTAHQLISTVSCQTPQSISFEDIIKATFPMGSMTGAPKVSAMKLIDRYETSGRGLYSGCAGYITPEGDFDFSVVIRSILYDSEKKYLSFSVGSAITAASDPEAEYAECMVKAKAMIEVLGGDFSKFA